MSYWLMKSEPDVYPWERLVKEKHGSWDGVRSYQAANNLRAMQVGDEALFYHSNIGLAVVGIMKIVKAAYPDPTDPTVKFVMVDVAPVKALLQPLPLKQMKADKILSGMAMVKQSRLSVSPVTPREWQRVLELSGL
ncbi:MAG: EVE domain-containing protein [Alphaproteobacteria bacterium]|nr:EVE domain-containing protein [Alphaproteobacteria bacterium]